VSLFIEVTGCGPVAFQNQLSNRTQECATVNYISEVFKTDKLSRIEQFFATDVAAFTHCLSQLDSEIDANAMPQRGDAYHHRVQKALLASQESCRLFEEEFGDDIDMLRDVQQGFRNETDPWLSRSWFAQRARTKPSGFAGDYDMLLKIYEKATPARGLGGYLDLCLMDSALAQAVRARMVAAREFLIREIDSREGQVRILDIACGPCREFNDWPFATSGGKNIEVVALDSDPEALRFVDSNVSGNLRATDLQTTQYNALRTRSAATNKRKFGTFDVIYSVGLCDYLSDRHLIGMLSAWRETLNEGGVLYVAFKDCERYEKTLYQWHLDWFFFQRTEQDVLNLFKAAGFDVDRMETSRDDTGIVINFIDRQVSKEMVRIDAAEESLPANAKRSVARTRV
jgi:extracellular factor (EF) 3-hydroxypalmitic acid methyl ester biosynthesis protein